MKRCPQCNRIETDDALAFCRADGTALGSDSEAVGADSGTVKFGSAPVVAPSRSNSKDDSIYLPRSEREMNKELSANNTL